MATDIDHVLREVMATYVALSPEPPEVPVLDYFQEHSEGPRRRWSPVRAFAATSIAVLAVGVVLVVLSLGGRDPDSSRAGLRPIDLGSSYIWPEQPGSSSPEALGAAFAVEVLGWDEATVERLPGADPAGPVWVQVNQPGREPIDLLTAPHLGLGRVLHQVGMPPTVGPAVPGETGSTRIGLIQPSGATHAQVTVRVRGSDSEVVLSADATDLAQQYVETSEIPDSSNIVTVIIRYLDNNGDVLTATGGEYSLGEPPPVAQGDFIALPYRLLIEDADAGNIYVTDVAANASEFAALWSQLGLVGLPPEVDFESSVVFYFGAVESGSCPLGQIERLTYNAGNQRIYPEIPIVPPPGTEICTSDANRHAVLVAVERAELPEAGFSLWISADDPPGCCLDGVSLVAPGELTAPPDATFPPLAADGSLAVGESRIAYGINTHCGVEWLVGVSINKQTWRAIDLDKTDAVGIDPVPSAWGQANDSLDLVVTLVDDATLEVTRPGTGVTATYIPDPNYPLCD